MLYQKKVIILKLILSIIFQKVKKLFYKTLCRVGNEVRIFPLLDLKGNRSEYLKPLTEHLKKAGYQYKVEIVDYEFQKGGNEMLRIKSIK
jgi:hypothetical protein